MEIVIIALFYFQEILKPIIQVAIFVIIYHRDSIAGFFAAVIDQRPFVQLGKPYAEVLFYGVAVIFFARIYFKERLFLFCFKNTYGVYFSIWSFFAVKINHEKLASLYPRIFRCFVEVFGNIGTLPDEFVFVLKNL